MPTNKNSRLLNSVNAYLNNYYHLSGVVKISPLQTDYYWGPEAKTVQIDSSCFITVFERNFDLQKPLIKTLTNGTKKLK
ncbi:MAG: hypothetical protein HQL13_02680 [Candidatus Omnitrophica bacterium]|nr:hypothetical protein [Candidatus Omnitrophota bacterium]